MPSFERRWKFAVETSQGDGYLTENGYLVTDPDGTVDWVGTDNQADKEASRRGDAFEDLTGGRVDRIVYESQGKLD